MSEVNSLGGAEKLTGGAGMENHTITLEATGDEPQGYTAEAFKRLQDDVMKQKRQNQEILKQAEAYKAQLEENRLKAMKQNDDWKGVAAEKERLAAELEQKYTGLKESIVTTHKADAVKLAALKAGLSPGNESLLEMMPMDEVQVEFTSNGRMLTHGADEFVAGVRMKYPSLFSKPAPTGVNSGGVSGVVPESNLTAEYMVSLEKSDPAKYKALMPAFLAARRKK